MNDGSWRRRQRAGGSPRSNILERLPPEHSVFEVYARDAGTIQLRRMVTGFPKLVESLNKDFLGGDRRLLARSSGFRPWRFQSEAAI